ncbi:hypothetical protein ACOSQ4_008594 [Xanthoceras sorbifolium]
MALFQEVLIHGEGGCGAYRSLAKLNNFFCYKVCRNILHTRERLKRIKIITSDLCPLCNKAAESSNHVLWSCEIVIGLWKGCPFFKALNKLHVKEFVDGIY